MCVTNELKYAIQGELANILKRRIAVQIKEKESLKRYILNSKREIGLPVKVEKPHNISEAQNQALEMEMWLKESQSLRLTQIRQPKANMRFLTRARVPSQNPVRNIQVETMENLLYLKQEAVSLEELIEMKNYEQTTELQQPLDNYSLFSDVQETEGNIDYLLTQDLRST